MATLSTVERRAINLTWAKPFDGNSPLMRYILEMSENSKVPTVTLPMSPHSLGTVGHNLGDRLCESASPIMRFWGLCAGQISPLGSHGFLMCKGSNGLTSRTSDPKAAGRLL